MSDTPQNNGSKILFGMSDVPGEALEKSAPAYGQSVDVKSPLMYALQRATGSANKKAPRLAFTENPAPTDNYLGLYKSKRRLLPDEVLKQIRIQDHLVAAILRARGSMFSLFGHSRKDRFDTGFEVAIKKEFYEILTPEQYEKVMSRVKKFENILLNCGHTAGLEHHDQLPLSQYIDIQMQNGMNFGRFGTEVVYDRESDPDEDGNYPFHRFRPIDVATVYRCVRKGEYVGNNLRETAMRTLESITGDKPKIDIQKLKEDQYAWLQVIDGTPRQAFTHREMLVYNVFPCTDIEMNGYPVSPLDTVISSVTTHISIDAYKKLYFQNGRATRGMLVIKSDEVDEAVLNGIKLQFNASVNNVANSFRTPIFGMGLNDSVDWLPFSGEGLHDDAFQFMYDQIARNIMSAFSISPDELPGYSHLSRGTNSQTLSECFDPSTPILTREGLVKAEDLLGDRQENDDIEVWTGKKWENARIFWTGVKKLRQTVSKNGFKVNTSPDHKFRVIGEDGSPMWKTQQNLGIGDMLLINSVPVSGNQSIIPYFNGKQLTSEMVEYLGWITGDGSIVEPKQRAGGYIKSYYHHVKEKDVQERHALIALNFGLEVSKKCKEVSEEEQQAICQRYGFNSTAPSRLYNVIYSSDFVRWLKTIGFSSSSEGKTVPSFLHSAPIEYRTAFLKGIFSADGHATANGQVILTVQNEMVREDVRKLLIGLGIRTTSYKGIDRRSGFSGATKTFSHKIFIKDTGKFWEMIGFNQEHKQNRRKQRQWPIDGLPLTTTSNICKLLLASENIAQLDKMERDVIASGASSKRPVSKEYLVEIAEKTSVNLPEWFTRFHFEEVISLSDLNEEIEMVDVEVFNDEHMFMLNGFMVHNSNNEFKLTAARDTGLRPLLLKLQTFFNQLLFPLIDPLLAKICEIKFCGLDAQSKEQESTRLQQDMPTFMTYDEVLHQVDKQQVGKMVGGNFPFNERYSLTLDKYKNVGEVIGIFFDDPSAYIDPMLRYKRDPFFLQSFQLLAQTNPIAAQAYFAPRPFAMDLLEMEISDILEEDE
jgi:intein/homing endonuclease